LKALLDSTRGGRALALAVGLLLARPVPAAADLAGQYVAADQATPPAEVFGGTVDLAPRRHGYAVTWHLVDGARRLRGLGLRDGDDLLAVSIATGGAANGVQVFHRAAGTQAWRGAWITSIDGAGVVGEIAFDTDGPLAGKHPLHCRRPGAGSFEGAVDIAPRGDDFLLTFTLAHSVIYRGLGIRVDDNRLAVAWSFGSSPALALYRLGADGMLTGRRLALRGGRAVNTDEHLARAGADAARLLPPAVIAAANAANGNGVGGDGGTPPKPAFGALSPAESALLAMMEPGAPAVKDWNYDELQRRYGAEGWADRWLAEQLTPEENALLKAAVRRRSRTRLGPKDKPGDADQRTVGQLIEAERQRERAQEADD
jgi:hypothetical protein